MPQNLRLAITIAALTALGAGLATPRFDLVSIHPVHADFSRRGIGLMFIGLRDPGLWQAPGQPLLFVVMSAYGFGQAERSRLINMPQWTHTAYFDIEARVPPHATSAQIPQMVQAMLADRFQLKAHWEDRPMPAVALTVAPGGPRMQRDTACEDPTRPPSPQQLQFMPGNPAGPQTLVCGTWSSSTEDGELVRIYYGFTMRQLARQYSSTGLAKLPVLDRTHLTGAFDFTLRAQIRSRSGLTQQQLADLPMQGQHDMVEAFRKQLGLVIGYAKPQKLPVPVLVIDQIKPPAPN